MTNMSKPDAIVLGILIWTQVPMWLGFCAGGRMGAWAIGVSLGVLGAVTLFRLWLLLRNGW